LISVSVAPSSYFFCAETGVASRVYFNEPATTEEASDLVKSVGCLGVFLSIAFFIALSPFGWAQRALARACARLTVAAPTSNLRPQRDVRKSISRLDA